MGGGDFSRGIRQPVIVDLRSSSDSFVELLGGDGTAVFSSGAIDGQAPGVSGDLLRQVDLNGSVLATIEPSKGVFLRESIRKLSGPAPAPVGVPAAYTNGIFMPGGANRVAEAVIVNNRKASVTDFLIRADT